MSQLLSVYWFPSVYNSDYLNANKVLHHGSWAFSFEGLVNDRMAAPYNLTQPGQIAVDMISRLKCDHQVYHKYLISIQLSSLLIEPKGDVMKIQKGNPERSRSKAAQESGTNESTFIVPRQAL